MRIALLGFGAEVEAAAKSILKSHHTIVAVTDAVVRESIATWGAKTVPNLVSHHDEVDLSIVSFVVLLSYAPLIDEWASRTGKFLNIHFALLPKYRGMHPIQWALINGETTFGYTLHVVDAGVDSGPIIFQDRTHFVGDVSYSEVKAKISECLHRSLGDALSSFEQGDLLPEAQDESLATYFAKRGPEDGLIDWRGSAKDVHNLVRALAPPEMPGAYFFFGESKVAIALTKLEPGPDYIGPTGRVVKVDGQDAIVKCGSGLIRICTLFKDGREFPANELLRRVGARLGRAL